MIQKYGQDKYKQWHSPNHNARPAGTVVDTVVIHNISLPPDDLSPRWVRALFTNQLPAHKHPYFQTIAGLRVSAHFYIARNGRIVQCVPLHRRAWHAGKSSFTAHDGPRENVNHSSIGIELAGTDSHPFTLSQYQSLAKLLSRIGAQFPLRHVLGHSNIAPGRKTDPGECFDWAHLQVRISPSIQSKWQWRV